MKILMIDDSKAIHAFVKDVFKAMPYTFTDAYNGKEGIEKLKTDKFDLILLDWEMPVMTGPETLKEIVASGVKCPVIMMTSKNAPEDIAAMLDAGAAEYIIKPFTNEILMEKVANVVSAAA